MLYSFKQGNTKKVKCDCYFQEHKCMRDHYIFITIVHI
jgi:hypothetical protein